MKKVIPPEKKQSEPFEVISERRVLVLDEADLLELHQAEYQPEGIYDRVVFLGRCPAGMQNLFCTLAYQTVKPGGELLVPSWLCNLPFVLPVQKIEIDESFFAIYKPA